MDLNITIPPDLEAQVTLPTSKSVANRELMLAALSGESATIGELLSHGQLPDDVIRMNNGLRVASGDVIDVGGAGTALRFLTAYWTIQEGHTVTLTGDERLCQRPIAPLIDALRQLGADITCLRREGHAPLRIAGRQLHSGRLSLPADVSSQFVSALLMIGPVIGGLELELVGDIVSRPYIDMTLALMARRGVAVKWQDDVLRVPGGTYMPAPVCVEGDWSTATFWLALQALLPQAHITLHGLRCDSVQGDRRIITIMEQMGMTTHWHADGTLTMDMNQSHCCCCSTFADLTGTPDLAPVLVVLLCLLGRPFRITGLRTLRHKESDRLEALRLEAAKLGYALTLEGDEAISWHFATCRPAEHPRIDTHGDHRIAMAFALAAVRHQAITISDAQVIGKSYPNLWHQLGALN